MIVFRAAKVCLVMPKNPTPKRQSGREMGLTYTRRRIHCPATADPYVNEQDEIDIDNFLNTLVEIAMAITSRKLAQSQDGE